MSAWQPIETAPKDRPVLLWDPRMNSPRVAFWGIAIEDGEGAWVYARQLAWQCETGRAIAFLVTDPSHWQPLPEPPAA